MESKDRYVLLVLLCYFVGNLGLSHTQVICNDSLARFRSRSVVVHMVEMCCQKSLCTTL